MACATLQGGFVPPMCGGLSACVLSHDQQTLALPIDAMGTAEQQAPAAAVATLWAAAAGPGQREKPGPPGVRRLTERLAATLVVASCGVTAGEADVCSWQTMTCSTHWNGCRPRFRPSRSGPTP